jgi:hypothetical protein
MVEDGVIRWIDLDGLRELPPGTHIVDGGGGYLIPGLADLHINHFPRQEHHLRARRRYDERDLALYPVNGGTLVRVMGGSWAGHGTVECGGRNRAVDLNSTSPRPSSTAHPAARARTPRD